MANDRRETGPALRGSTRDKAEFAKARANWDGLAEKDLLWSVLAHPSKKDGGWNEEEFFQTGIQGVEHYLRYIRSVGLEPPQGKVLDFGCGVGRLTQALCRSFESCCGVDISPRMIAAAQGYNRFPEKCSYRCLEGADLGILPDEEFDFILSINTLQHIEPEIRRGYLREFLRVLRPGGLILIQLVGKEVRSGEVRHRTIRERPQDLNASEPVLEWYGEDIPSLIAFFENRGGAVRDVQNLPGDIWVNHFLLVVKEEPAPPAWGGFPYGILPSR